MSITPTMRERPVPGTSATYDRHEHLRYWTRGGPVDSELLEPEDVAVIEERSEASVAEPSAFALFGLAVGTFVLGYPIAGFVPVAALAGTIAPVLILAGVVQFIGGLFALRRGNAFTGTTFCILGGHYAVIALFALLGAAIVPAAGAAPALTLALELYCFGYIALVLGFVALRLSALHTIALLALVPGYVLTGMTIWYGTAMPGVLTRIGGYCLIASAAFAAYAATATVVNSTTQHNVLPLVGAAGHTVARRRKDDEDRSEGPNTHDGGGRAATDEAGRPRAQARDDMTRVDELPEDERGEQR